MATASIPAILGCTPLRPRHPLYCTLRPARLGRTPQRPVRLLLQGNSFNLCGARPQYAELAQPRRTATRQARAQPRRLAATQGLRDSDARPSGPCIRGATAFVHRIGPATLSDTSLLRRQPARRRPSSAQCFTGRPSDTPVVKTTGQAEHACNTPNTGTAPTHGNTPGSGKAPTLGSNSRPARLGCTPSAALAPAAPQHSSTGSAQRRSVTSHCGEDNQPCGDHLRHSASLVGPVTPRRR
jgi:hypothetical protein